MVSYNIFFKKSAEKELRKVDKSEIPKILTEIQELTNNPFPQNSKKLVGSDKSFRLRVGNYRVLYIVSVEDETIEVQKIRHRKDAYR